jgi:hypothetical protein
MFSNAPSLCPSLNVRDKLLHSHKTTAKIIVWECVYHRCELRRWMKIQPRINLSYKYLLCVYTEYTNKLMLMTFRLLVEVSRLRKLR